jgi:hypothetical protein
VITTGSIVITKSIAEMVRDARRCRAPHHEGVEDLIPRNGFAVVAGGAASLGRVSKDEATVLF